MHVIRVMVTVPPANVEAFVAQLDKESAEVPARFGGCQKFRVYHGTSDPNDYLLYEEWDSEAAFNEYRQSDYFKDAGQLLFPLIDGAPDSAYFDAQLVGP